MDKVKKIFKLTKISYAVYNLDEHFNRDAFVSEFGEGSTFPQVIVDGKKIGGCIDTVKYLKGEEHRLMNKLKSNNDLEMNRGLNFY